MVRDDSKFIYASIASLEEHLIFGSLFAAVVVMFFIRNLRARADLGARHPGVDHLDLHAEWT
jgi:Cu/Ag efflux pump CusA